MGVLLGLDTLVSHAYGAGRIDDCHRWLVHGVVLSLVVALPVTLLLVALSSLLDRWGLDPTVLAWRGRTSTSSSWSVLPLLLYATFRRYLQGMGIVRPVMIALVSANLVNVFVNWVLIYGKLGAPAMGVRGAAWATVLSRVAMAGYLFVVIVQRERGRRPGLFETSLAIDPAWMRRLLRARRAGRVTADARGRRLCRLDRARRATGADRARRAPDRDPHRCAVVHGAARCVVGRRRPRGPRRRAARQRRGRTRRAGRRSSSAPASWRAPPRHSCFSRGRSWARSPATKASCSSGVSLLAVGAIFQLFDGIQGVATGVLRGLGDTRTPMLWNLVGHWFVGLPSGYVLCFVLGLGVIGLWWGLSIGLIICGAALLSVWARRIRALRGTLMKVVKSDFTTFRGYLVAT